MSDLSERKRLYEQQVRRLKVAPLKELIEEFLQGVGIFNWTGKGRKCRVDSNGEFGCGCLLSVKVGMSESYDQTLTDMIRAADIPYYVHKITPTDLDTLMELRLRVDAYLEAVP